MKRKGRKLCQWCWLICFCSAILQTLLASEIGLIPQGEWPIGLEREFKIPEGNPVTPEKVELGARLFFDPRLSKSGKISCATCHDPRYGFSSGGRFAKGHSGALGTRNVPTIINRLFGTSQFWDGRAKSLEEQVKGPLLCSVEMGMVEERVTDVLLNDAGYVQMFRRAFNADPDVSSLSKAIASFERTLLSASSPFDKYEWLGDNGALSEGAKRGLALFRGKARCSICHIGPNFTDERFHNLGVSNDQEKPDAGRLTWTHDPNDFGKFRTPTLRNVRLTAPYMHDGSMATLLDVVSFYNRGGGVAQNKSKEILPLNLADREMADLIEFLNSLTGSVVSVKALELSEDRE